MKLDNFMFGLTVTHTAYYLRQIHLLPACYCFFKYFKHTRSLKMMCVQSYFFSLKYAKPHIYLTRPKPHEQNEKNAKKI